MESSVTPPITNLWWESNDMHVITGGGEHRVYRGATLLTSTAGTTLQMTVDASTVEEAPHDAPPSPEALEHQLLTAMEDFQKVQDWLTQLRGLTE